MVGAFHVCVCVQLQVDHKGDHELCNFKKGKN